MKDGTVIEMGDYKTLVDQDGIFAAMYVLLPLSALLMNDTDLLPRWKKQIFTDAEMLAVASGTEEAVIEALPEPEEVLAKGQSEDDYQRTGPPSVIHEKGESSVGNGRTEPESEAEGYEVEHETGESSVPPPIAEVEGVKSLAEAAKTPSEDVAKLETEETIKGEELAAAVDDEATVQPEVPIPIVQVPEANSFAQVVKEGSVFDPEPVSGAPSVPEAESVEVESTLVSETIAPESTESPAKSTDSTSNAPSNLSTPFPSMPHLTSSASQGSISKQSTTESASGTGVSPSPAVGDKKDEKKSRKRLSSIKGFVRRISDQGSSSPKLGSGALSRSSSYNAKRNEGGSGSGSNTPLGDQRDGKASAPGTPTPDGDKKKRFSFQDKK